MSPKTSRISLHFSILQNLLLNIPTKRNYLQALVQIAREWSKISFRANSNSPRNKLNFTLNSIRSPIRGGRADNGQSDGRICVGLVWLAPMGVSICSLRNVTNGIVNSRLFLLERYKFQKHSQETIALLDVTIKYS